MYARARILFVAGRKFPIHRILMHFVCVSFLRYILVLSFLILREDEGVHTKSYLSAVVPGRVNLSASVDWREFTARITETKLGK